MSNFVAAALGALLLSGLAGTASAATPPIVSVACTAGVAGCAFAADGDVPAQGQFYQSNTAYWAGTAEAVVYTLNGPQLLTGFLASLDNNDTYRFDVSSNGTTWATWTQVDASLGPVGGGMDTFSTNPGSPFYTPAISFSPTLASFVRIVALGGDGLYSVGELTLTSAVPEPASTLLALGGLAVLALRRSRRR